MLRENQERMLQTLMMIQKMQQEENETEQEKVAPKVENIAVSKKSTGIASQLFEHFLKAEDMSGESDSIKRRETFDSEEVPQEQEVNVVQRKRREILKCPHTDKKHYAKNMCHNCYHRKGKTKMAWACEHTHKSHYSSGMCQNCYLAKYYIKRKNKMEEKEKAKKALSESKPSVTDISSENNSIPTKRSAPTIQRHCSEKMMKVE